MFRQPLFQFRYDIDSGKFIREIREADFDNARRDPNFVNGRWMNMISGGNNNLDDSFVPLETDNSEEIKQN